MVQVGSRLFPSQPEPAASGLAEPSAKGNASAVTHAARNASGLQRKSDFAAALDRHGDINPHMLARPSSPNTLVAGSVLSASLITGLNSDLPGLVTAQVTQNVHDNATGRTLLVPPGGRPLCISKRGFRFGQK